MALLALNLTAFASGELADPAVGGDWNADATWSGGVRPVSGEAIVVKPTADAKLTLSADDATDYKSLTFHSSAAINAAASVEFDCSGHTLLLPYSEKGVYESGGAFTFLDGESKQLLHLDQSGMAAEDRTNAAPVRLTDAHFKLSQTAGGASSFVLDRGKMDFYTDGGSAVASRIVRIGGQKGLSVAVTNATLEVPKFLGVGGNSFDYSFDRATFLSHGLARFAIDNGYYYGVGNVTARDSTFQFLGGAYMGRSETNLFENCTITGGTIDPGWTHELIFRNCTMPQLDGYLSVGCSGSAQSWEKKFNLTFDGGTYTYGESCIGSTAKMTVTGDATVNWIDENRTASYAGAIFGTMEVLSGTFRTPPRVYRSLYVGVDSSGRLDVKGGLVEIRIGSDSYANSATDGLAVGGTGRGEVHLSGGEIYTLRVSVGYDNASSSSLTSCVYQTGGFMNVSRWMDPNYSCLGLAFYSGCAGGAYDTKAINNRAAYYFDGGVLSVGRIAGGLGSQCRGGSGHSLFSADGGTFRAIMARGSYTTISGLDVCEVGPKGLTIDSNGYEVKVDQNIVNKKSKDDPEVEEEGRLVKTGVGTLLYSGDLTASDLIVSGGIFKVASGTIASRVTVAPGTVFSTAGDVTALTLAGLTLTNATLQLDPGDVLTVNGPIAWQGLILQFTSAPTKDEATAFLKVQGEMSAETLGVLRRAFLNVILADGTHAEYATSYAEGVTTVTVTVVDDADPIADGDTVEWTGSGDWATAANWTPALVPTGTNRASFASDAAGKTVNVAAAQQVGALSFGADGVTLSGEGSIGIASVQGEAEIAVTSAVTATVGVPLTFGTVVNVPLVEKAKVSLAQPITGGGLNKTGLGTLALGADNAFEYGVTLNGGFTEVASDASLGTSVIEPAVLRAGGVRFDNAAKDPIALARAIQTRAGNAALVFEAETAATAPFTSDDNWGGDSSAGGYLYKKGLGELTFTLNRNTWITQGSKAGSWNWTIAFDENGFPASTIDLKGSLTVAEGLLRFKPAAGLSSRPTLTLTHDLFVGGVYAAGRTSPVLELDGVNLELPNDDSYYVEVGGGQYGNTTPNMPQPTLRLKNNARFRVNNFYHGQRSGSGIVPTVELFDSTFVEKVRYYLGGPNGSTSTRFLAVNSSVTVGDALDVSSITSTDFTNSTLTATGTDRTINFRASYSGDRKSGGYLRFAADSKLYMRSVQWYTDNASADSTYLKNFKLVFDDATWDIGETSMTLSETNAPKVNLKKFSVELQAGGLKLPVASGKRIHTDARFWGTGGIEKSGEGTLSFGPDAYQFTGPLCALAGTVDLSNAGTLTNACLGAGAGTIVGGTFRDAVFTLGDAAPALQNCAFENSAVVDVGDEPLASPLPKDKTLFTFTGTAPDVSGWRLRGKGKRGLTATFAVDGNAVKLTISRRGVILLLR